MKLIESDRRTATLQLSRRELAYLMDALTLVVGVLLENEKIAHKDEGFLPRVQTLLERITQIALTMGWQPRGRGCALIRNFVSADDLRDNSRAAQSVEVTK
jgi:hypothetical protein